MRQSVLSVKAEQVATFPGRVITPSLAQELGSQFSTRIEGTCIKHRFGTCSIKMYDKCGIVLRIEVACNDVSFFKHHRKVEHRDRPPTRALDRLTQPRVVDGVPSGESISSSPVTPRCYAPASAVLTSYQTWRCFRPAGCRASGVNYAEIAEALTFTHALRATAELIIQPMSEIKRYHAGSPNLPTLTGVTLTGWFGLGALRILRGLAYAVIVVSRFDLVLRSLYVPSHGSRQRLRP